MPSTLDLLSRSQRLVIGAGTFLTVAAAVLVVAGTAELARFIVSGLALAALAALVGESIEQIGERLGPGPTGLLQSSLGNLPELFVGIFALRAGLDDVVRAALVGSVLSNVLLVLGAAFLTGGARHGPQSFQPEAPRMLVTLLTLAIGGALVPTLANRLDTPAVHHTTGLSDVTAIILLLVYLASIPFWLSGGPGPRSPQSQGAPQSQGGAALSQRRGAQTQSPPPTIRPGQWPLGLAVIVLALSGLAAAFVSDWFVSALSSATSSLGLSPVFTGLVVVAIASNAVENAAGIRFAWKARPDYAISTILNSPLQVMLLLTPVLVLSSRFFGPTQLTMVFPLLLVAALAVAVIVVGVVLYDGEYSWLEGVALIALYLVIAASFWWG